MRTTGAAWLRQERSPRQRRSFYPVAQVCNLRPDYAVAQVCSLRADNAVARVCNLRPDCAVAQVCNLRPDYAVARVCSLRADYPVAQVCNLRPDKSHSRARKKPSMGMGGSRTAHTASHARRPLRNPFPLDGEGRDGGEERLHG